MSAAEVLALVDGLRARGVVRFQGLGLEVELGDVPSAPPTGQPHTEPELVDPDLLGHET